MKQEFNTTKRLFLSACVSVLALIGFAQGSSHFYFDLGLKGGYGLNLLVNKNILNDKHVFSEFSFAPTFGARLGGNFNERHSINIEVLSSSFKQDYTIRTDSLAWNKTIAFKTLDVALLYKKFVEGTYIEVGPEVAFMSKASETNSVTGNRDITKEVVPTYFAGVFGFGANFLGNDNFCVMAGVRATYSFTDILSDGAGKSNVYSLNDNFYKSGYTSYKTTNPLTIRLMIEVSFDMGYFARSNCKKKRTKFLGF